MSNVSVGKRTRVVQSQTQGVLIMITPASPVAVVIGGLTDDATADHRCAQLRAGVTYACGRTTAGSRRLSMISMDPTAPDDALPTNDPNARLVDVSES